MLDADTFSRLEAQTEVEMLRYLGTSPLAERHLMEGVEYIITGVADNTYNGVVSTRLSADTADRVINDVLQVFRTRGLYALWYVDADSTPTDLPKRLERAGCDCISEGGIGMGLDMQAMNEDERTIPNFTIRQVLNEADMAKWSAIYASDDEQRKALYSSFGFQPNAPLRHYLGLLNEQPVATASLFLGSDAAAVHTLEVIPAARRQGIGTAMTLAALRDAREAGYRYAVIGPTPEAMNMYSRIGFRLHPMFAGWYAVG